MHETSIRSAADHAADRVAWASDIARQLAALPQVQRTAVQLLYGSGLLVAEVAQQLELTVKETSAAIAEALQTLGQSSATKPEGTVAAA